MLFTKERHRRVAVSTIFFHIIALLQFSGDATIHWCRRGSERVQRAMNGRLLEEGQIGKIPNVLHNYSKMNLSTKSFVQVKVKDSHDRNIRRGGVTTSEGNYHIPNCDDTDESSNFLKKFCRSMKSFVGITPHDKDWCLKYEKFRRFKQHFVYMVQNNLSLGKTRVCLIDTGLDLQDKVVRQFVKIYRWEHSKEGDNPSERSGGGEYDTHLQLEERDDEGASPSWAYPKGGDAKWAIGP